MLSWTTFLIVCPLVFLGGFVDAVAGGGGLISLPAYMISGIPVHMAIGTNKLSSAMGTTLATWRFGRSGYIDARIAIPCAAVALAASTAGANLALLVREEVFKVIMLVILPLVAAYVMRSKTFGEPKPAYPLGKTIVLCMLMALVVGVYDGFYGPGTGTFLLLLLTGVAHLTLQGAAGTTKVINLSTNIAALAVYLASGNVLLPLGAAAGCFGILGNYLGTRFFTQKGAAFVRPVIIVVLVIFFVRILVDFLA